MGRGKLALIWWEEKGITEDELVGWHHRFDGHEFEEALGVGDGQGSLVCCSPWGHKELDTTEQLYWLTDWFSQADVFSEYRYDTAIIGRFSLGMHLKSHLHNTGCMGFRKWVGFSQKLTDQLKGLTCPASPRQKMLYWKTDKFIIFHFLLLNYKFSWHLQF